jgi:hypothetical protein
MNVPMDLLFHRKARRTQQNWLENLALENFKILKILVPVDILLRLGLIYDIINDFTIL